MDIFPVTFSNLNNNTNNNNNISWLLDSVVNNVDIINAMYAHTINQDNSHNYPTATQIDNATRQTLYSNINIPGNHQCPISMEEFNDNDNVTIIRGCGHIFNTNSLMNWFTTNSSCPVCRYDIRTYNRLNNNNDVNYANRRQPRRTNPYRQNRM